MTTPLSRSSHLRLSTGEAWSTRLKNCTKRLGSCWQYLSVSYVFRSQTGVCFPWGCFLIFSSSDLFKVQFSTLNRQFNAMVLLKLLTWSSLLILLLLLFILIFNLFVIINNNDIIIIIITITITRYYTIALLRWYYETWRIVKACMGISDLKTHAYFAEMYETVYIHITLSESLLLLCVVVSVVVVRCRCCCYTSWTYNDKYNDIYVMIYIYVRFWKINNDKYNYIYNDSYI